jgi:hypothetical protein
MDDVQKDVESREQTKYRKGIANDGVALEQQIGAARITITLQSNSSLPFEIIDSLDS